MHIVRLLRFHYFSPVTARSLRIAFSFHCFFRVAERLRATLLVLSWSRRVTPAIWSMRLLSRTNYSFRSTDSVIKHIAAHRQAQ